MPWPHDNYLEINSHSHWSEVGFLYSTLNLYTLPVNLSKTCCFQNIRITFLFGHTHFFFLAQRTVYYAPLKNFFVYLHPSIHLSICPFNHLSPYSSIYRSIYPFIYPSTYIYLKLFPNSSSEVRRIIYLIGLVTFCLGGCSYVQTLIVGRKTRR